MKRFFCLLVVVAVYVVIGYALLRTAHGTESHRPAHSAAFESGANAALNMTLLVASEWRSLKINFSWEQLETEVARRLSVRRNPPWKRQHARND